MSCAEVEVVKRLRAADFADAGWLATCGQATWGAFQRPRDRIRGELEALAPGRSLAIPSSGAGSPDVAALTGPSPIFVECKGTEPLQENQVAWLGSGHDAYGASTKLRGGHSAVRRPGRPGATG